MNVLRHAVLAFLFAPLVAFAHHGWSEYDANQSLKLTGTIEEAGRLCLFLAAEATFTTGVDHILSGGAELGYGRKTRIE